MAGGSRGGDVLVLVFPGGAGTAIRPALCAVAAAQRQVLRVERPANWRQARSAGGEVQCLRAQVKALIQVEKGGKGPRSCALGEAAAPLLGLRLPAETRFFGTRLSGRRADQRHQMARFKASRQQLLQVRGPLQHWAR